MDGKVKRFNDARTLKWKQHIASCWTLLMLLPSSNCRSLLHFEAAWFWANPIIYILRHRHTNTHTAGEKRKKGTLTATLPSNIQQKRYLSKYGDDDTVQNGDNGEAAGNRIILQLFLVSNFIWPRATETSSKMYILEFHK